MSPPFALALRLPLLSLRTEVRGKDALHAVPGLWVDEPLRPPPRPHNTGERRPYLVMWDNLCTFGQRNIKNDSSDYTLLQVKQSHHHQGGVAPIAVS